MANTTPSAGTLPSKRYQPLSNVFTLLSGAHRPGGNLYLRDFSRDQRDRLFTEAHESAEDSLSALRAISSLMFWANQLEEAPDHSEYMAGLIHAIRILTESTQLALEAREAVDAADILDRVEPRPAVAPAAQEVPHG